MKFKGFFIADKAVLNFISSAGVFMKVDLIGKNLIESVCWAFYNLMWKYCSKLCKRIIKYDVIMQEFCSLLLNFNGF
jgi:hypothetical protein